MLADAVDAVIGVDTHTDSHTACLLDHLGRELTSVTVEATPDGYAALLNWALQHAPGPRLTWAVEGCRSHGAGLLRTLQSAGQHVIEAGRPQRPARRPGGKSDPPTHASRPATPWPQLSTLSRDRTATGKPSASCWSPASTPPPRAPLRSTSSSRSC
jgi:hypothetical protein